MAQAGRLAFHAFRDAVRFWRYSSLSAFDSGYEQVASRIMYNVHALEKGLAQSDEQWSPGRGKKALRNLNDAMVVYRRNGYGVDSFSYIQGLAILQRYIDRHAAYPDAVKSLKEFVSPLFLDVDGPSLSGVAGTKVVRKTDKDASLSRGFYDLSQSRSSVRAFSGLPIDPAGVLRAIENAEKTPSVCNRQGWRVYWTENKDLAQRVLQHQRGFSYPQMPQVLLTVTVSNSAFISPVERNQGFVDGGLYAMSVLYGLEAEGLAAVPLNACLYARDRAAIQKLLEIDPSEEIIMFIAIGDHPETAVVPISDRRPTEAILRRR